MQRYAAADYDILVLTDHGKTNDVVKFSDRRDILVVSGMECHPFCPGNGLFHIIAINVPHNFYYCKNDPAECVSQISHSGGVAILAHPFWSGHDFKEITAVCCCAALEVYNSSADPHDRAESSSEWAMCLEKGYCFGGVAVDDTHMKDMRDLFMGWTYVKMEELNCENLIKAIHSGSYYASCGPEIKDFRITDDVLTLKCSPVEKMILTGHSQGQGKRTWAEEGAFLTHMEVPVSQFDAWPFIRAVVIDRYGKKAWTNPIIQSTLSKKHAKRTCGLSR